MDGDILRVWQLVHELSEQLALNQKITNTLQSQAGSLKVSSYIVFHVFADLFPRRTKLLIPEPDLY